MREAIPSLNGIKSMQVDYGKLVSEFLWQRDPDHYDRVERITTATGARTGFLSQNSGRLYVAVPHRGSQAAKVLVYTIEGG